MNPHTRRDFVQFGKTESVLNKRAKKIALLFNPPPVLYLKIIPIVELKESNASKFLKKLVEVDAIEPVSGHGKGRYKFKS